MTGFLDYRDDSGRLYFAIGHFAGGPIAPTLTAPEILAHSQCKLFLKAQ
jgi:hypothetical protein